MECNLCGKEYPKLNKAMIEGSIIDVCDACVKFGTKIADKEFYKPVKKPIALIKENNYNFIEHYGKTIVETREKKGLSRREFEKLLNEKDSLIERIEKEVMEPDEELTKKIEKFLGVKLTEKYEDVLPKKVKGRKDLTVGDVIEVG